jgi:hypothetical protein
MRVKILSFKVTERYVLHDSIWNKIKKFFLLEYEADKYHFDVMIKIDPDYKARRLEPNDFIELPNKIRLQVWSVDRFDLIKAKTYKFVSEDLRKYKPMEFYLVYPHVHGHITDRAS